MFIGNMRRTGFGLMAAGLIAMFVLPLQADESMSKDQKFVKHAYLSNLMEVREAEIVNEKGSNERVKSFAQMMIDDHTKANEQLKPLAQQLGVDLPDEVMGWQQEKLDHMRQKSGEELWGTRLVRWGCITSQSSSIGTRRSMVKTGR